MRTLSGILDYVMRRKLMALGILVVLVVGIMGIRTVLGSERGFISGILAGLWGEESVGTIGSAECDLNEMDTALVGGGGTTEAETGAGEKIVGVGAKVDLEVPKTGELMTEAEERGVSETNGETRTGGISGLIISIAVGVILAAGLMKFVSDHYIR